MLTAIGRRLQSWYHGQRAVDMSTAVDIHPDTRSPLKAWQKLSVKQTVTKVEPIPADTPVSEDKLRCVCISDTHARIEKCPDIVPAGDVLLHAGDFTNVGIAAEVKKFNEFLGSMPHRVKIVIAGNHDLSLDYDFMNKNRNDLRMRFGLTNTNLEEALKGYGVDGVKELLTNCVYLEDAGVNVCGINVYGSPWQPEFCDWAFNLPRGEKCLEKWNMIPDDTDILVTHGPPIGHGDKCFDGQRAGCVELLTTVQKRVKPKYHIYGHIHEGYGVTTDGQTIFINASTCTLRYRPDHAPIVFDIPIPEGHTKGELLDIKPHRRIRNTSSGNVDES